LVNGNESRTGSVEVEPKTKTVDRNGAKEIVPFFGGKRFGCRSERGPPSEFYFEKPNRPQPVSGDDVDFSGPRRPVSLDDAEPRS
jgi:hypothetical protein